MRGNQAERLLGPASPMQYRRASEGSAAARKPSPKPWKIGGWISIASPERSRRDANRLVTGRPIRSRAVSRGAPFGVPVVPDVTTANDHGRAEPAPPEQPDPLSRSRVGAARVHHDAALNPVKGTRSSNGANSSSCTRAVTCSRSRTPASAGTPRSVLMNTRSAPSR